MTVNAADSRLIGARLGKEAVDVTVTIRDNQPENVTIFRPRSFCFHAEWAITFNLCQAQLAAKNYFLPDGINAAITAASRPW